MFRKMLKYGIVNFIAGTASLLVCFLDGVHPTIIILNGFMSVLNFVLAILNLTKTLDTNSRATLILEISELSEDGDKIGGRVIEGDKFCEVKE